MEPMSRQLLRTITRERLRDTGTTRPRWSNETIDRFLNEAQRQAAIRARLLFDNTSTSSLVAVTAGVGSYFLPRAFFEIESVTRESSGEPLPIAIEEQMYRADSRWRTRVADTAREVVLQSMPDERLRLILYPIPQADDSLRLAGYREPLFDMEDDGDEPEIAARHHEGLVAWACYRCLSIRDPDGYDPVKAADHLGDFEREFGPLQTADVRRKHRERREPVTIPRDF